MSARDCNRELVSIGGLVILVMVMALAWPGVAAGADPNELIREGVALRRKGEDHAALQRFQQAFQIDKSPRAAAQMGLAEQALGRWAAAYEHLSQSLETTNDPWMAKNRSTITDALTVVSDHVGTLEILGGSPHAEVRIDGVSRGTLPLGRPLTLSTGTVTIDLSLSGHVPVQRTTMVRARQTIRESFDALAPLPTREAHVPPPAAVAITVDPTVTSSGLADVGSSTRQGASEGTASAGAEADRDDRRPSSLRRSAKWVAWGLGGAAAGLGIFGYVRQNDAADSFDRGCGVDSSGGVMPLPGSTTTTEACRSFKSGIDSNFRLEVIGLVGAAVLVGTGFVLWLTEPKISEPDSVAWACAPGFLAESGLWMECGTRF